MGRPPKRQRTLHGTLQEIAQAEDPHDKDYTDSEDPSTHQQAIAAKPKNSKKGKRPASTPKGRRSTRRSQPISDQDDDLDISMNDSAGDDNDDREHDGNGVGQTTARGTRQRRAALQAMSYKEPDEFDDQDDEDQDGEGEEEEEEEEEEEGKEGEMLQNQGDQVLNGIENENGQKIHDGEDEDLPVSTHREDRSLILSIPTTETGRPNGPARIIKSDGPATRRTTRATSADTGIEMVELTSSGRHTRIVRSSTRSPEATKKLHLLPPKQPETIKEEDEPRSSQALVNDSVGTIPGQGPILESDVIQYLPTQQTADLATTAPDIAGTQASTTEAPKDVDMMEVQREDYVPESQQRISDDDQGVITRRDTRRRTRSVASSNQPSQVAAKQPAQSTSPRQLRSTRQSTTTRTLRPRNTRSQKGHKKGEEDDDFKPDEEEADDDDDNESENSAPRGTQNNDDVDESPVRRLRPRPRVESADEEGEAQELAHEVADLAPSPRRRRLRPQIHQISYETKTKPRRTATKKVDYRLFPSELPPIDDEDFEVGGNLPSAVTTGGGSKWKRQMFSTYGPFGGAGGGLPLFGEAPGMEALGGADSDSSDDEFGNRKKLGSAAGLPGLGAETVPGVAGTVANLGKVKDRQAMADNDPLGVDQNVNFDSVGGLQGHIDKLKEMVSLPLLYPEIFQKFHLVPPRGVLFHGPPGTGKTLLARALASSLSSEGKKVTFYMRKGADALSKWVGEAERQLRLLFEDARKNQPSIIFFDEIDGLAPVRSSKQEQIHASIVSTLLALMDGMDGRGQVIVIGATNRPDSVDPALRRPGRFDREFYFPLPNIEGRRAIIDIHTRGWQPPVSDELKDKLAELTKGYGGADLRALCTEAALNAVQRKYPQIYRADKKLLIDPSQIQITPRDFMISTQNIVPSSERSSSSLAAPLPPIVEPLLKKTLASLQQEVDKRFPRNKSLTALEEAQYEQPADQSFNTELLQRNFQTSRVYRPTLLIRAKFGQGIHYVGAALLHHLEGVNVQAFDLPTLLGDSTRSPEAILVQLFAEVKRRKPSVIYLPDFIRWEEALSGSAIATFSALLRSIKPTDPILLLGLMEQHSITKSTSLKTRFGFVGRCEYVLSKPSDLEKRDFFQTLERYVRMAPSEVQDPEYRKKRDLEALPLAPVEIEKKGPTKDDLKATKKKDRQTLNLLKIRIQPIMDQIKKNYRRFRTPVIDEHQIAYLFEEEDPNVVTSDLPLEHRAQFRPFEKDTDKHGVHGLREVASGKFFYNLDITTIEKRLSNGYYKRPSDFLADIKRIAKDARQCGDYDRQIKGNELLANVEVDIGTMETTDPVFVAECENVFTRELEREKVAREKARIAEEEDSLNFRPRHEGAQTNVPPHGNSEILNDQYPGPIVLGESFDGSQRQLHASDFSTPTKHRAQHAVNGTREFGHTSFNTTNDNLKNDHSNSTLSGFQADVQMSNTDESNTSSSLGPSAQPRPYESWTAPSQALQREQGMIRLSQGKAMTTMVPGSQPTEYVNDASTTQTGTDQKNSGQSKDSDQRPPPMPDLQPINSFKADPKPNFSLFPGRTSDDAHLPNTQAGDNQPWSFHNAVSPGGRAYADFSNSSSESQKNNREFNQASSRENESGLSGNSSSQSDKYVLSEDRLRRLIDLLVYKTTLFDVEQLETAHAELIQCIWEHRGEWNRDKVIEAVFERMNQAQREIEQTEDEMTGFYEGDLAE